MNWGGNGYAAYDGLMKGNNSQAEMNAADQQRALENSLAQQQWNTVSPAIQGIINNGGLSPGVQSAMTSNAMQGLASGFRNNIGALNQSLVARGMTGGSMAGSGDVGRQYGSLGALEDSLKAGALNNIQIQKQANLNQALGLGSGLFGATNSAASGALNSGVDAANNADQNNFAPWGAALGAVGSIGSAAAGRLARA